MTCRPYQKLLTLAACGAISERSRKKLDDHVRKCPSCAGELGEAEYVCRLLGGSGLAEYPDGDWEASWERIRSAIEPLGRCGRPRSSVPKRWIPVAAGLLAVGIAGFFIGRPLWMPERFPSAAQATPGRTKPAAGMIDRCLGDLEPLLVDFSCSDSRQEIQIPIGPEAAVVKEMQTRITLLRKALEGLDQETAALLDELDILLREIAGRERNDLESAVWIRRIIRERDLLVRLEILKST